MPGAAPSRGGLTSSPCRVLLLALFTFQIPHSESGAEHATAADVPVVMGRAPRHPTGPYQERWGEPRRRRRGGDVIVPDVKRGPT